MNSITKTKNKTAVSKSGSPEAFLIVKDREHLHILGRFIQAMFLNFLKKPGKVRVIERTRLIVAFDPGGPPEKGLTISFKQGRVCIENGITPDAQIRITGEPAILMMLSRIPAGWPLIKYFMSYEGKDLVKRILSGELKLKGVFRHPVAMMKFSKIMAPNIN